MTWILSKALCESLPYSREQEEESSEDCDSDGKPYAPLNVMPTQHRFSFGGKTMEHSRLSRFGLTLRVLTESRGEELLMSFRAAFPARTYLSQEKERESMGREADYGVSSHALFAKYDRESCSWKTAQPLFPEDLTEFSETWPRWGSMLDGVCYQQQQWVRHTSASASGLWPTPTVSGNYNKKGVSATSGDGLETAVKNWPTPTASAHKGWAKNHNRANTNDRLDYSVEREAFNSKQEGRLSPNWCEWLMGWPVGWTSLEPLTESSWKAWLYPSGWWSIDPATGNHTTIPETDRVTEFTANRGSRIKAIGNGQVPDCAACAYRIATDEK